VDIDYKDLMLKKRDVVASTVALNSMLTDMQLPLEGDVLLRSDEYGFPIISRCQQGVMRHSQFFLFEYRRDCGIPELPHRLTLTGQKYYQLQYLGICCTFIL
jgi:hypothetical protein